MILINPSPPNSFTTFGDLLKYLRRREQLTQLELSITVGYSEAQIGRLEKNQRRPDLTALKALFIPALHLENEPELTARFLELAQSSRQEDAPVPGIAPYKGLLFFDESDSDLFFGRETLTTHLADRVTGSGNGRFYPLPGCGRRIRERQVVAGARRVGCDTQTYRLGCMYLHAGGKSLKALEMQLEADQAAAESERVLILVDQFEEVFTLCHDESERVAFIEKFSISLRSITKNNYCHYSARGFLFALCTISAFASGCCRRTGIHRADDH